MSKIKYATLSLCDDQQQQQQQQQHEQLYQSVLQTNDCNNKNLQDSQHRNGFEICSISLDTTHTTTTSTTLSSTVITTANSYLNDASFSFINTPVINDVFTQEANFAVPVMNKTWSTTTQIIDTNSTLTPPIFTVPQNVCIKPTFDDDTTHWHGSTDLLELDHRYNSCLQTDLLQTDNPSVIVNNDNHAEAMSELNEFMSASRKGILRQEAILTTHKNSQQQQQHTARVSSDSESDFEDRNLSWLLNFKFDEFPHLSPDAATLNSKNKINFNMTNLNLNSTPKNYKKTNSGSPSLDSSSTQMQCQSSDTGTSTNSSIRTGKRFEELVMEATSEMDFTENMENDNPVIDDISYRM